MSADASVVVILTSHGYVYCYNGEGEALMCGKDGIIDSISSKSYA
jgi:hypothetical protein